MRSFLTIVAIAALSLLVAPKAEAGGFEYPGAGASDLGRGGAWFAKADTSLALRYNPAALARMPSRMMIDANATLNFYDICFDRYGTYDTHEDGSTIGGVHVGDTIFPDASGGTFDPVANPGVANPMVCDQRGVTPVPQLTFAFKPKAHERLALGFGVLAPHGRSGIRFSESGDTVGYISTGNPDYPYAPSPTRYMTAEISNLQLFPTVGVAYQVHEAFRVGVAFGWGMTIVGYESATQAQGGNEYFVADVMSTLKVKDLFVPRINVSVDSTPVKGLNVMAGFQYTANIDASGTLELSPNYYLDQSVRSMYGVEPVLLDGARLAAGQASWLNFGVNYGLDRNKGVAGEIADGLGTQWFDVEFNFTYEFNNRVDEYVVTPHTAPAGEEPPITVIVGAPLTTGVPNEIRIAKHWQNQYVLRFGADVNPIPGRLALRAGAWYESNGIGDGYANVDFFIPRRIGVTGGVTARFGRFDLSVAYAHVFFDDVDNPVGQAALRANSGLGEGSISNNGRFTAKTNLLNVGLRYHFK